jgi:hypothetical protein
MLVLDCERLKMADVAHEQRSTHIGCQENMFARVAWLTCITMWKHLRMLQECSTRCDHAMWSSGLNDILANVKQWKVRRQWSYLNKCNQNMFSGTLLLFQGTE